MKTNAIISDNNRAILASTDMDDTYINKYCIECHKDTYCGGNYCYHAENILDGRF